VHDWLFVGTICVPDEQPTLERTLSWPFHENLAVDRSPVLCLWAVIKMVRHERPSTHTARHSSAHLHISG
jgi:hypothetical protein